MINKNKQNFFVGCKPLNCSSIATLKMIHCRKKHEYWVRHIFVFANFTKAFVSVHESEFTKNMLFLAYVLFNLYTCIFGDYKV